MQRLKPLACVGLIAAGLITPLAAQKKPQMPREDVVEVPAIGKGLCLHNLFQSNMIIQRDKPVGLWGWADPGEKVTVTLAGKSETATAGKDRSWKVSFPAMPANAKPITVTVKGKSKALTLKNILLGDVWVENNDDPDWGAILEHRGASLHLYGKHQARRGRKMGHITFTAPTLEVALDNQNQVRKELGMPELES